MDRVELNRRWKPLIARQRDTHASMVKLWEEFGRGKPEAYCDTCGAPLFEGDKYRMDNAGLIACVAAFTETGNGPCYNEETSPPASE